MNANSSATNKQIKNYTAFVHNPDKSIEDTFFEYIHNRGEGTCTAHAANAALLHTTGQEVDTEEFAIQTALTLGEIAEDYGLHTIERHGGLLADWSVRQALMPKGVIADKVFLRPSIHGNFSFFALRADFAKKDPLPLATLSDHDLLKPALVSSTRHNSGVAHIEFVSGIESWVTYFRYLAAEKRSITIISTLGKVAL